MNQIKLFLTILFLAMTVHADFKEVNLEDIDFAVHMLAKNLDSCWKEPKRVVSLGIDSIVNKTSQSVGKERVAGFLVDALGKTAKFDVVDGNSAPRIQLVIQGKTQEAPTNFQGSYNLEFSIGLLNGSRVCKQNLLLTKSALIQNLSTETKATK